MQRKQFIYLLAILVLLASMLPLAAAAQEAPTASYSIEEFASSDNKALDGSAAAGAAPFYAPDTMALFNEMEPNGTAATANALSGSQAVVYGNVSPAGDNDYFSFTANAGDRVYAAIQTQWSNASGDSRLDVIASDGVTSLEFDDDNGSFSGLSSAIAGTIIPSSGTYYVRVYGYSASTVITPYHLHLRVQSGAPTAEVEPNNDTTTATPLAISQWMSGTVTAVADPDFFSFTLNAGDSVFLGLDMDPGRVASNTNWNGRLGLGPFNNFILVANDTGTTKPHAEAFFMTVQQAGTYYAYVDSTSATGLGPNARYHLSVSIYPKAIQGNCTTFTSTDVPKAIGPGVGTTTSTITVPGTVTSSIEDVNATIVLTHTNMPDLDVTLVGPTMVSTPLFTDIGASSQTQMNVGLDDQAALPIGPFAVVSGMINQPESPGRLYTFNGTPAAGTWTLQLADDLAANGGILQSWSLEICGDPPPDYAIELVKTVGLDPNVCAATDSVTVPPGGFDVYYCYTVRNTGLNTLTTHDLVDSELGTLLSNFSYSLAPGASTFVTQTANIDVTTVNTATWTAGDGTGSASDSDTATVNVPSFCPAGYRDVTVDYSFFDNPFPPAGWSVTNTTTNCNATGAVPEWTNTNPGNRANLTGGAGPFAIADSDKCGSGNLMDTIMSTGALDFTGLISPTIRYNTDYYDLSPAGGAQALLDLSTDGGATWSNLLTWNGSQRGPLLVTQALTGAAGQSDARVRWHYAQASWDWWWQVDNALITACEPIPANPAITLDKTVGTDPNVCAVTDEITVAAGTEVTYCYEVTNTGDVTFSLHDLDDSELGTILSNFPYTLAPSASAFITETATINVTTVNTATWTAYELFDGGGVSSTDTATVTVEMQDPPNIYVNPLSLASTQPPDVQMQEMLNVANTGGGTLNWSIAEENTPFAAGVPSQAMNAAAGSQTLSAAGSFASGMQPVAPVSRGVEALVNDGSFENGPPPASGWTEVTNSTCEWIGDWSGVWGAAAYDGSMDFWGAGYCGGVAATSSVDQMVAVPAGGATLSFWYMSYRPDPDDVDLDYAYVEVNGTQVWSLDLIQANDTYPNWVNATVDLSAYAGQNVSLELGAVSQGTDTGNIRFDYVELGGPACSAPSDIPWLSLAPTSGANAGGTDTDVTVTFDSTGLAAGTYTGNLCVDSNDPDPGPGNETEMVVVPVALTVETQAGPPLVCNAPAVGFEEGVFPTGWSYTTLALPGGEWVVSTDNSSGFWDPGPAPEGVYYASANDDLPGSGSNGSADYLYTNIIDLSGYTAASLNFAYHFNGAYGQTAGGVAVSGDGGVTWGSETIVPTGANWQTYSLNLSAYAGNNNVQVRFHSNDGGNWASGYAIDNVSLDCAQGNDPNIDVSPLSLSETHATPPQNTSQTLTVANTGGGTLNWSIAEEPASVLVRPDAPNAAVSAAAAGTAGSRGSASGGPAPLTYSSPADFSEGFDDITTLPGWYMQNNSSPLGLTNWFQGNNTVFPAHAGAPTAYIGANFNNTAGAGTISNWLLTPELNLSNGDTISFWTRTATGSIWADRLQVRLSTAGSSTNVGTLATDVGDFTTLLLDINPTLTASGYPQSWTQYTATLSGIPANATGRFAFRYFVTDGGPSGNNSNYIGIDTVEYTSAGGGQTCDAPADVSWLSLSPTSGANAGGTNTPVTVGFNSTGLVAGTYNANLCITSNDPDAGPGNGTDLVIVPVTLIVGNPTAVTLDGLSAAQAPLPLAGLPLAALPAVVSMALGAAYVLRRQRH